jgi:hypothetical protein
MATVTVRYDPGHRAWLVEFSKLPGRTFGPWDFGETVRDLRVSALLEPVEARNLVMDATAAGTATTETR